MKKRLEHRVLAEGEVTGHAHRASGGTLYDQGGVMTLEIEAPTTITHEEHGPITVLPEFSDCFRIGRVQEMDHAGNEARQVVD